MTNYTEAEKTKIIENVSAALAAIKSSNLTTTVRIEYTTSDDTPDAPKEWCVIINATVGDQTDLDTLTTFVQEHLLGINLTVKKSEQPRQIVIFDLSGTSATERRIEKRAPRGPIPADYTLPVRCLKSELRPSAHTPSNREPDYDGPEPESK